MDKRLYDDRSLTFFPILMLCLIVESYKVSSLDLFSLCLYDMNTRILTSRIEEGGLDKKMVPPHIHQVPIVCLEEENEEVPLQEPQVPLEPQEPQVPPMPQPFLLRRI